MLICVTPAFLAETWISVGESGVSERISRIVDLNLRNLTIQTDDAAGIDQHLQPLVVGLDAMDDRLGAHLGRLGEDEL